MCSAVIHTTCIIDCSNRAEKKNKKTGESERLGCVLVVCLTAAAAALRVLEIEVRGLMYSLITFHHCWLVFLMFSYTEYPPPGIFHSVYWE